MENRLFLGIADNDHFAMAVLGDDMGRIIKSYIGPSINYHYYGTERAKENLQRLLGSSLKLAYHKRLAKICVTFQTPTEICQSEMSAFFQSLLGKRKILIKEFLSTSGLGIFSRENKLLIMGDNIPKLLYKTVSDLQIAMELDDQEQFINNLLKKKLEKESNTTNILEIKYLLDTLNSAAKPENIISFCRELDRLADNGSLIALAIGNEIAFALAQSALRVSSDYERESLIIGVSGIFVVVSKNIKQRLFYLLSILFPKAQIKRVYLPSARGAYYSALLEAKGLICETTYSNLRQSSKNLHSLVRPLLVS